MADPPRKRGRPPGSGKFKNPPKVLWSVKRIEGARAKQLTIVYAHTHAAAVEEAYKKLGIVTDREKNRIFVEKTQ